MPSADSGAISRPRLDFQPACEQELLSIMRTCAGSGHCVPCSPHRPKAHAYIYKDKAFGLRTRPPDRNGDATRLVDHGKARYQPSRSEFCTRVFPFPVQDACGPRDSRRRTRKATASGAARLEQSHGRAAHCGAAAHPALGDTILPGTFERGPHSVYLQRSNGCRDLRPVFCIPVMD